MVPYAIGSILIKIMFMNDTLVPRRYFLRLLGLGASAWCLFPFDLDAESIGSVASVSGSNVNYPGNRPPLRPVPYLPLPLGSVKAEGWLLEQLRLQKEGLTGHAEELADWLPALQDSAWTGGAGEDWEKGPYYVKGLVPLAYTLNDEGLKKKAQRWVDGIIASQTADGFFGPPKNLDWWPRMVVTYILRDYQEATGDPRVIPFLEKYYRYMAENLPKRPLVKWGKARAADEIDTIIWLYNRTGEAYLLQVAQLLQKQAFDWVAVFESGAFMTNDMLSHTVNVSQALKAPGISYMLSGDDSDRKAYHAGSDHLKHQHDIGIGVVSGTEHLAGRSPNQGAETCATVESMLSAETLIRIFGEASVGDELEKMAFNALPAALSDNIHQHVYYTVPNLPVARVGEVGYWEDHKDDMVPAPRSGYPCCCYNFHMGWPKYVQNSWAATKDGGLAVIAYGPTQVAAKVANGVSVTITEKTNYPFNDTIEFKVDPATAVRFPLDLRIPSWCEAPQITVNGEEVKDLKPSSFARIDRTWSKGDTVTAKFPMSVRVEENPLKAVSVLRGPIVYSLEIEAQKKVLDQKTTGFESYELSAKSPWNYGLDVNLSDPAVTLNVDTSRAMPVNPFVVGTTPVRILAKARRIPSWTLGREGAFAEDPPFGPVKSSEPEEVINLVPYGTQFLKITHFPRLGDPVVDPKTFSDNFSGTELQETWTQYAGGWFLNNGVLNSIPKKSSRLIASQTNFDDLVYEAELEAPREGAVGVLFRVTRPGFKDPDFNGYFAGIDAKGPAVVLAKSNGRWQDIKRVPFSAQAGQKYKLKVVATGPDISVYVENMDAPLIQAEDREHQAGAIGLRQISPRYTKAEFGPVSVRSAP